MTNGRTLVVGLGEVGGALANVLERTGPVLRHDIEPIDFGGAIAVMHVCIPFTAQNEFNRVTVAYIRKFSPALTVINSTVIPGTTRLVAEATGMAVVYSPVRGKHIKMEEDLLHYDKFVTGFASRPVELAEEHFQRVGMRTRRVLRPETLELAKLAETTYFGLQIAFAQELNRYAERVHGDYSEAIGFFEEVAFLPRMNYFPGHIGGHCVIPNINLLRQLGPSPLLEAILNSNELRQRELADNANLDQQVDGDF